MMDIDKLKPRGVYITSSSRFSSMMDIDKLKHEANGKKYLQVLVL